jgi:hypothetical protein
LTDVKNKSGYSKRVLNKFPTYTIAMLHTFIIHTSNQIKMTAFKLPMADGKPLEIIDFKVDFLVSPPEIKEEFINSLDSYLTTQNGSLEVTYKDANTDEGRLNIYLCKFKAGKYRLHIFGRIKGQEFRIEKVLSDTSFNCRGISSERIKYVLLSSRNILKKYYLNANLKSIENHLQAFLISS